MATGERPRDVARGPAVQSRQERRRQARRGIPVAAAKSSGVQPRVLAMVAVLLIAVLGGGAYAVFGQSNGSTSGATGANGLVAGGTVDGIQCQGNEKVVYHVHSDLRLYDHGHRVVLPAFVGIPASNAINVQAVDTSGMSQSSHQCVYWLHTHNFDSPQGVIHIESPTQTQYTLGQFFDIWRSTASVDLAGGYANEFNVDGGFPRALSVAATSSIHAYVDGVPYHGSYRDILLRPHRLITIELGTPQRAPLTHFSFPQGE